jgi:HK97 family phage major capsid protein
MSKILEEKKNDLITRGEELTKVMNERELTPDEAQELAEIRDDVRKIKEALGLEEDMREILDAEAKKDNVPTEEDSMNTERACEEEKRALEQRALQEEKAFEAYIRNSYNERGAETDLTKGDNGAVIPATIANRIIKKVYDICPILERSTKFNVKGTLTIPYYNEVAPADHITVAYAEEFTPLTSHVGKFTSTITLTGFLAGALVKVSRSLINNSQFNIVDYVIDLMAEHIARFIEKELLIGTPAVVDPESPAKVLGLYTLTNAVTAASETAITADEIVKLHDAVKDRYQSNAIWIMSPATRTALRLLKDEMGRYLLQDDISSPFGSSLLGKPVYVSDNMPEIASGNNVIYYGDMKGLATKFDEEINIQVLRERFADEHADGVVGWFSFDAKTMDQQMIAKLTMAS